MSEIKDVFKVFRSIRGRRSQNKKESEIKAETGGVTLHIVVQQHKWLDIKAEHPVICRECAGTKPQCSSALQAEPVKAGSFDVLHSSMSTVGADG